MTEEGGFELVIQEAANVRNVKTGNLNTVDAADRVTKDYLTAAEFEELLRGAKQNKHALRDQTMLLFMYRHGLRVSELIKLKRGDLDLKTARIACNRLKDGLSTHHPIAGDELRAIKAYLRTRDDHLPWLFINEKGNPLSRQAINYVIARAGENVGMKGVHPHMLRHSCGYAMADKGLDTRLIQDYLGHRNIRHTAHYTRTAAKRFEGIWE